MDPTRPQRGSRRKSSLAFPFRLETKRGSFMEFLEDSGTLDIFLELFSALFAEREKPEDPIRWAQKYLQEKAPERPLKLDLVLETLQQEILQTAYEIEEVGEQLRRDKGSGPIHPSSAPPGHWDHDPGQGGADERWWIKPDPLFRPTAAHFRTSARGVAKRVSGRHAASTDTAETHGHVVPPRNTTTPEDKSDADASATGDSEEEELDTEWEETATVKSTQTLEFQELEGGGAEEKEEAGEKKDEPPRGVKYKIYDPTFFARKIPDGFWKDDFSLDNPESEDEEEERSNSRNLVGVNYKFRIMEETSWLPKRNAASGVFQQRSETFGTGKAPGSASRENPAPSPGPPPPTAREAPERVAVDVSHYEWIQKTYGPILLRENKHATAKMNKNGGNVKEF